MGPLDLYNNSPDVLDFLREALFTFNLDGKAFLFSSVLFPVSAPGNNRGKEMIEFP